MIQLIVCRHGNTFDPGDAVLRIGARTDLALSRSGREQASILGRELAAKYALPQQIFVSPLQRTRQTAKAIAAFYTQNIEQVTEPFLREIDYGPDEGQPEAAVQERLGAAALKAWEEGAHVPNGWRVDPVALTASWERFLAKLERKASTMDERAVVFIAVTSAGIAKFLPLALGGQGQEKLRTGAYGEIARDLDGVWMIRAWNIRPETNSRI